MEDEEQSDTPKISPSKSKENFKQIIQNTIPSTNVFDIDEDSDFKIFKEVEEEDPLFSLPTTETQHPDPDSEFFVKKEGKVERLDRVVPEGEIETETIVEPLPKPSSAMKIENIDLPKSVNYESIIR